MKKYQIIYADPPWSFRGYDLNKKARYVGNKYPVMAMNEIQNLPVGTFEYKTIGFTWVKRNKKSDRWFWGMGRWTRANAELCLIATKGNPKRISASVHSIIDTPIERHSKKPSIVRDKIVQLVGDLPRIELFARQNTKGWDAFGNEVENSIVLPPP